MNTRNNTKPLFWVAFVLIAVLIAPALSYNDGEKEHSNLESKNKAIVQAAFDAWSSGAGSPFDILADNAEWTIVGKSVVSKTYPNRATFISEVIQPFNARMSKPLRPNVRKLFVDGDNVVVFFDASATAVDGRPYVNTYVWLIEMKNGKAIKVIAFFDPIEFNDLWSRVKPIKPN